MLQNESKSKLCLPSKEPDVHDKEEYLSLKNAYFSNVQVEMIFIRGRQIHVCKFHGELRKSM